MTILEDHPFCRVSKKNESSFKQIYTSERKALDTCCSAGCFYVDVPIDLQGLDCLENLEEIAEPWQLQKRAVDEAFRALSPLATYLGAVVARFRWMMVGNQTLGIRVFETYPAGSLELLADRNSIRLDGSYKGGRVFWRDGGWAPAPAEGKKMERNSALAALAGDLNLRGCLDFAKKPMSDDEFDAIVCAVTGAVDSSFRLEGQELREEVAKRLQPFAGPTEVPKGFRLLKAPPPETLRVTGRIKWKEYLAHVGERDGTTGSQE